MPRDLEHLTKRLCIQAACFPSLRRQAASTILRWPASPSLADRKPLVFGATIRFARHSWLISDMSCLYGTLPVEKLQLEGDTVKFKVTLEFGGQEFDMEFEGKLAESQLTGGFETSRGVQEVTGTKMVVGS